MNSRLTFGALILILAVALASPQSVAQQQLSQKGRDPRVAEPLPPLGQDESSSAAARGQAETPEVAKAAKPDQRPLSGVESYTLESLASRGSSFLKTTLSLSQLADSNPRMSLDGGDFLTQSIIQGRLSLERLWSRYHLSASYSGGALVSPTHSELNSHFHSLGVAQRIEFGRWRLTLGNDLSYTPESAFGFLGGFGVGAGNLNMVFVPSDTILAGRSRRISNTSAVEAHYQVSPRSTMTASASYGLLLFPESALQDHRTMVFGFSQGYLLNRTDTVYGSYRFSRFSYPGSPAVESHSPALGWGRRLSQRMFLNVSGGPELQVFRDAGGNRTLRVGWGARTDLGYMFRRSGLNLSYYHYTTGGSGVLLGADSDVATASYWRQMGRAWTANLNGGYARNRGLQILTDGSRPTFHAYFAGAGISRSVGRYANLSLHYAAQHQQSSQTFCVGGTCGRRSTRHVFGIGINFDFRPIGLD